MDTLHTAKAIDRVVGALRFVKKAELARRADVPESTLRDLGRDGWAPNASTLQKLEEIAIEIERENEGPDLSPEGKVAA